MKSEAHEFDKMKHSFEALDGELFEQANELLDKQPAYRRQLQDVIDNNPKTGVYQDEIEQNDNDLMFEKFVHYIQQHLSRSTRTVLRASLDHTEVVRASNEWPEICALLFVKNGETRQTFHEAGKRMKRLSPGRCFEKLSHANRSMQKLPVDVESVIEKQRPKDPEEFRRAAERSMDKKRQKLQAKILKLTHDLQTDTEYKRYCQLQKLWKDAGAERLWNNFIYIDLFICRSRGVRGHSFEKRNHKLLFYMVALQLKTPVDELTYETNIHWWEGEKQVGEIDLVIIRKATMEVVAICEIKNSYVEISTAIAQHQCKLASVEDDRFRIGLSSESCYGRTSRPLPFFVATALPASNNTLGVEPALVNAVCEGIRDQGLSFADTSERFCSQVVSFLELTPPTELNAAKAIEHIESLPSNYACVPVPVDFERLKSFVRQKVGSTHLAMSPSGCARRNHAQIIVLPENCRSRKLNK